MQKAATTTPAPPATLRQAAPAGPTPAEVYQALRSQRRVLDQQMSDLEGRRGNLTRESQSDVVSAASRAGLEKRITEIDQRIAELDKQITAVDLRVSTAAAVPGATSEPPQPPRSGPPEEFYGVAALFVVVTFLPLSIAFARRIWRRAARVTVSLPPETDSRIANIERGLEAVAVEIERIGEGQRFVTQVLAEREPRMLNAPAPDLLAARRAKLGEEVR